MNVNLFLACLAVLTAVCCAEKKGGLQIGVKKRPETCDMRSKNGDKLSMHYTVSIHGSLMTGSNGLHIATLKQGTLEDGTEFDSSINRSPFQFTLGAGQVIKGQCNSSSTPDFTVVL